jgi:hypothetical protein
MLCESNSEKADTLCCYTVLTTVVSLGLAIEEAVRLEHYPFVADCRIE